MATDAAVHPQVDVAVTHGTSSIAAVVAEFTVRDGDGIVVAVGASLPTTVPGGGSGTTLTPEHPLRLTKAVNIWSIRSPALYNVSVVLRTSDHEAVDCVSTVVGFRHTNWTSSGGHFLNGQHVVLRGFSDHNSFAGVGVAVPPRINLYRAQMLRAVGGNIWRFSHNPGDPTTFDVLDRVGVLSWDENRDYGKFQAVDMADMVARDRNHPSIIMWSLCNEIECSEQSASQGQEFRRVTLEKDVRCLQCPGCTQ